MDNIIEKINVNGEDYLIDNNTYVVEINLSTENDEIDFDLKDNFLTWEEVYDNLLQNYNADKRLVLKGTMDGAVCYFNLSMVCLNEGGYQFVFFGAPFSFVLLSIEKDGDSISKFGILKNIFEE